MIVGILRNNLEQLDKVLGPLPKPSNEESPKLELKMLLDHLRYVFLSEDKPLPMILYADCVRLAEL